MVSKESLDKLYSSAKNKEELISLYLKTPKSAVNSYCLEKAFLNLEVTEINELNIIDSLVESYTNNEDVYQVARSISSKNNISLAGFVRALDTPSNKSFNKEVLYNIKNIIKDGIHANRSLEKIEYDYYVAVEVISLFLKSGCKTDAAFCQKFGCGLGTLKKRKELLDNRTHPFYEKYLEIKNEILLENKKKGVMKCKEEKAARTLRFLNLSSLEIEEILREKDGYSFHVLCNVRKLNDSLLVDLINDNSFLIKIFANDLNVYYKYEEYYKNIITDLINQIKNNEVDIYEYHLRSNLEFKSLFSFFKYCNNVEDKILFQTFYNNNSDRLRTLTNRDINSLMFTGIISCFGNPIKFSQNELKKAIAHLNHHGIRLTRATIYTTLINLDNINEYTNNKYKKIIDNASSLEEVIAFKWKWGTNTGNHCMYKIINSHINLNVDRITSNNAILNKDNIINDLLNSCNLNAIKEKYFITIKDIRDVVNSYLNEENYDERILNIKWPLSDINVMINQDRDFLCSLKALTLFSSNLCFNESSVKKMFKCSKTLYHNIRKIVAAKNHPIFNSYIAKSQALSDDIRKKNIAKNYEKKNELKKNLVNKVSNITSDEAYDLLHSLSHSPSSEAICLCQMLNVSTNKMYFYLKDNSELIDLIANNISDKEKVQSILKSYDLKYYGIITDIINNISMFNNKECEMPLNLYEYYKKTSIDFYQFIAIMRDIYSRECAIIQKYVNNYSKNFKTLGPKDLSSIQALGVLSVNSTSLTFTKKQMNDAINEMEDRLIPYMPCTLFYAIKKQKEKVKVKK